MNGGYGDATRCVYHGFSLSFLECQTQGIIPGSGTTSGMAVPEGGYRFMEEQKKMEES
jgi:hypothetical protein